MLKAWWFGKTRVWGLLTEFPTSGVTPRPPGKHSDHRISCFPKAGEGTLNPSECQKDWKNRILATCLGDGWCMKESAVPFSGFLFQFLTDSVILGNPCLIQSEPPRAYAQHRIYLAIIHETSIYWAPTVSPVLHWTLDINKSLGSMFSEGSVFLVRSLCPP